MRSRGTRNFYFSSLAISNKLLSNLVAIFNKPELNFSNNHAEGDDIFINAIALDYAIRTTKKDNWRGSRLKEREVKYTIKKHLAEDEEVERIFEIVREQTDYQ